MNELIAELTKAIDKYVSRQVAQETKTKDTELRDMIHAINMAQLAQEDKLKNLTARLASIETNYVRYE